MLRRSCPKTAHDADRVVEIYQLNSVDSLITDEGYAGVRVIQVRRLPCRIDDRARWSAKTERHALGVVLIGNFDDAS